MLECKSQEEFSEAFYANERRKGVNVYETYFQGNKQGSPDSKKEAGFPHWY